MYELKKKNVREEQWLLSRAVDRAAIVSGGNQSHRLLTQVPQACHPTHCKQSFHWVVGATELINRMQAR